MKRIFTQEIVNLMNDLQEISMEKNSSMMTFRYEPEDNEDQLTIWINKYKIVILFFEEKICYVGLSCEYEEKISEHILVMEYENKNLWNYDSSTHAKRDSITDVLNIKATISIAEAGESVWSVMDKEPTETRIFPIENSRNIVAVLKKNFDNKVIKDCK